MNKRGVELTINFIVMLILGLAVLSGSIILANNLFSKASEFKAQVDAQTEQEIKNLITGADDLVIVYPARQEIARSKFASFGIGVQNVLTTGSDDFTLDIRFSKFLNLENEEELVDAQEWLVLGEDTIPVRKGDVNSFAVGVAVPSSALDGVYIYDVQIYHDDERYSTLQKLYVTVG